MGFPDKRPQRRGIGGIGAKSWSHQRMNADEPSLGVWGRRAGLITLAVLAGCASGRGTTRPADIPFEVSNRYVYECEGDYRFSVHVHPDSVVLRYETETTTLPQVETVAGARYSTGEITFASEGMAGIFEAPGRSFDECVGRLAETPWEESALLGYDFRAVGQEPGWLVEIDNDGGIHLETDYGETEIHVAETPDRVVEAADTRSYAVRADSHDIRIVIEEERCEDTMSGEAYPNTVTLVLDGRQYAGCGTSIEALGRSPLAEQIWMLTDLGARLPPTRASGQQPYIQFDIPGSRVFAFGGCNSMVAPYTMFDEQILFRSILLTTNLVCAGSDLERQERDLQRALRATDRYVLADGTLRLYSGNSEVATFTAAAQ
jgi:uncharacterized membrane protein/membrane-bound inhibitor of C-type lysozyme